jgi:hypothetical protein
MKTVIVLLSIITFSTAVVAADSQLTSGNNVDYAQLLHAEELDAVLGQQPIISSK